MRRVRLTCRRIAAPVASRGKRFLLRPNFVSKRRYIQFARVSFAVGAEKSDCGLQRNPPLHKRGNERDYVENVNVRALYVKTEMSEESRNSVIFVWLMVESIGGRKVACLIYIRCTEQFPGLGTRGGELNFRSFDDRPVSRSVRKFSHLRDVFHYARGERVQNGDDRIEIPLDKSCVSPSMCPNIVERRCPRFLQ